MPQLTQPPGLFDDWSYPDSKRHEPGHSHSQSSHSAAVGAIVGGVVGGFGALLAALGALALWRHGGLSGRGSKLPPAAQTPRTSSLRTLARWLSNKGGAASLLRSSQATSYRQASSKRTVMSSFHLTEAASVQLTMGSEERGDLTMGSNHSMLQVVPSTRSGSRTGCSVTRPGSSSVAVMMTGGLDGACGELGSVRTPQSSFGPSTSGRLTPLASHIRHTSKGPQSVTTKGAVAAAGLSTSSVGAHTSEGAHALCSGSGLAPSTPGGSFRQLHDAAYSGGACLSMQAPGAPGLGLPLRLEHSVAGGWHAEGGRGVYQGTFMTPTPTPAALFASARDTAATGAAARCSNPWLAMPLPVGLAPAAGVSNPHSSHPPAGLQTLPSFKPASDTGLARVLSLGQAGAVAIAEYAAREQRTSEWAQSQADGTARVGAGTTPTTHHISVHTGSRIGDMGPTTHNNALVSSRQLGDMGAGCPASTFLTRNSHQEPSGTPRMLSLNRSGWAAMESNFGLEASNTGDELNPMQALCGRMRMAAAAAAGPPANGAAARAPNVCPTGTGTGTDAHVDHPSSHQQQHTRQPDAQQAASRGLTERASTGGASDLLASMSGVLPTHDSPGDVSAQAEMAGLCHCGDPYQVPWPQHTMMCGPGIPGLSTDDSFDQPPRDVEGLAYGGWPHAVVMLSLRLYYYKTS